MGHGKIPQSNTQLRLYLFLNLDRSQTPNPSLLLTMFSKLALFAAASMAVFVVALPHPGGGGSTNNSCNGGTVQCCMSFSPSSLTARAHV